ncbi:MAG: lysophospholipid acyltransferase family protein [Daejeonella sp.]
MNKIIFQIVVFLLKLISLLPFSIIYLISDGLFVLLYFVLKYRRKVVRDNLKNSFPEKSADELSVIEKSFYKFLADMILESVKSITISAKELNKRYKFENLEAITSHLENGRSVIAVSGHYGNWELGSLAIGLAIQEYDTLIVYKPLSDSNFDHLINSVRSRFGTIMVPMKQTYRKVAEYKGKGRPRVLVLVGDQTPTREESRYFTNFLNQATAIFLGVEKVAVKSNDAVIYFSINRIKRGYYLCIIKPLIDYPKDTKEFEITNMHTSELEKLIREKPDYWLWSHKRWKFKPENISA